MNIIQQFNNSTNIKHLKQNLLLISSILFILFSCKNLENRIIDLPVIEIERGLENLTKLKVSDFGKTVRYIPLETTDDGLVGRNPVVKVLRNHIVIESQKSCLLFDKNDGRFIIEIGHLGPDPEAFSEIFSWTDENEEFLYFRRQPNQLIKYDMQGNFSGKITFTIPSTLASCYVLSDSEIIGYFGGWNLVNHTIPFSVGFFDRDGFLIDTIPQMFPETTAIPHDEIVNLSVIKGEVGDVYKLYGNWGKSGIIFFNYKNDRCQVVSQNASSIWNHNGNIRFKEEFVDTLYTISERKLLPSIVFNTGKYNWPAQEKMSKKKPFERIFIADISENNTCIFFQCIRGLHSNESVLYNGLYDKNTYQTKLGKHTEGIEDDLTHFMPLINLDMSTSGEFVSIIEAYIIMDWLEKHPDAKNNEKLSFLKNWDAEMNPVIVVIE